MLAHAAIEFRHKLLDHRLSNAGGSAWSSGSGTEGLASGLKHSSRYG